MVWVHPRLLFIINILEFLHSGCVATSDKVIILKHPVLSWMEQCSLWVNVNFFLDQCSTSQMSDMSKN